LASESISGISEAASRYAGAVFDLALDTGEVDAVEAGLTKLAKTIRENPELSRTLSSPLFKFEDKAAVLAAIGEKLGLPALVRRFVGVVASNHRAGDLPAVARAFADRAARHRGASRAIARVARPLTEDQIAAVESAVSKALGRSVAIEVEVDPSLIGGLQIKMGSRLVDASIRTKLNTLTQLMKGA
jgi:F-type H+-transporting ATPase subunit delta